MVVTNPAGSSLNLVQFEVSGDRAMEVCVATERKRVSRLKIAGIAGIMIGSLILGQSLLAQETPNAPTPQPATAAQSSRGETFGGLNYTSGYSVLHSGPLALYRARHVAAPNLSNSPR